MATLTVKQSGGDYSTLNAALVAASGGDTISIEGSWTVDDTTAATIVSGDNFVDIVIGDNDAAHPGYWDTSQNHYRLVVSGSHALTISANGCTVDGLAIKQNGSGGSDEGIRINNTATTTIKNCLITCGRNGNDQDGIYFTAAQPPTIVHIRQCIIWDFTRRGIGVDQTDNDTSVVDVNVESCMLFNNGISGEGLGGGIILYTSKTDVSNAMALTVNVHNTISMDNVKSTGTKDYGIFANSDPVPYVFNISYSIDSDGSIGDAWLDEGTGNLKNRTLTDSTSPGTGDWVIVNDYTTSPYNFIPVDNSENDVQNVHSVGTAHGVTISSNDIINASRPLQTNYEIGPFEIVQFTVTHDLTATGIRSGIPIVGRGTIGQKHILLSVGVRSATPISESSTLGQTHPLGSIGLNIGVPIVEESIIAQLHSLDSVSTETNAPVVGTTSTGQEFNLGANDVNTTPNTESTSIAQTQSFSAVGLTTTPETGLSALGQNYILLPNDVLAIPETNSTTIVQRHFLYTDDILSNIIVDTSDIGQGYILSAEPIEVNSLVGDSNIDQTHVLVGAELLAIPNIDSSDLAQEHILGSQGLFEIPLIQSTIIEQVHILGADSIEAELILDFSSITQTHELSSIGLLSELFIESTELTQTHVLNSSDITTSPEIEPPILSIWLLIQPGDIDSGTPLVDDATLTQTHVLSSDKINTEPYVETNELTIIFVLESDGLVLIPSTEETDIEITYGLSGIDLVVNSEVSDSAIGQEHVLLSEGIETISGIIDLPDLHKVEVLDSGDLLVNVETEQSLVWQIHSLRTQGINTGSPISGELAYGVASGPITIDRSVYIVGSIPIASGFYTEKDINTVGVIPTAQKPNIEKTFYKPEILFEIKNEE